MSRTTITYLFLSLLFACSPKPAAETASDDLTTRGQPLPESYDQPAASAAAPAAAMQARAATAGNPIQLMTGVWVSEEDAKETILFTSTSYTSFYENEKIVEEQIEYEVDCQPLCTEAVAGSAACFVVRGEVGFTCYTILYVDQNRLEMRPTGATDIVLKYKRVS